MDGVEDLDEGAPGTAVFAHGTYPLAWPLLRLMCFTMLWEALGMVGRGAPTSAARPLVFLSRLGGAPVPLDEPCVHEDLESAESCGVWPALRKGSWSSTGSPSLFCDV